MKRLPTLFAALCLTFAVSAHAATRPAVAPFSGTTLKGKHLNLKDFLGKSVIVTFWATWCKPCKKAIPLLEELAAKDPDVEVIAISLDDAQTQARVRGVVKKKKFKSHVIIDGDGSIAASLNPRGLAPLTLVVGPQGGLALALEGFNPGDDAKVAKALADLKAEAAPKPAAPPATAAPAPDAPKEATP